MRLVGLSLCVLWVWCWVGGEVARAEDIFLKCDEFDGVENLQLNNFCTVSGFTVGHGQNVKIENARWAQPIRYMKFYDSRLLYVPYKLFDVFPNLKTLDISATGILDVPLHTFSDASNLTLLVMKHNELTQLTTSVFTGAFQLKQLDLSYNKLSELSDLTFRGLTQLYKITLDNNRLTTLSKQLFVDNNYVEFVSIQNNLLEYIEPEVFRRMVMISDINLANNRLTRFHPDSFHNTYLLSSLILSGNRLRDFRLENKSVSSELMLDNNQLTTLAINRTRRILAHNNRISRLEVQHHAYTDVLKLTNNSISDLSVIGTMSSLTFLDLSYNPLPPINVTSFDQLKRLETLSLEGTGLRQLKFGMFSKLTHLQVLRLGYNNLSTLNVDMFVPYLGDLRELYVDANNLTEVQGKQTLQQAFPKLEKLGISRNKFECTYLHELLVPPRLSGSVKLHIEQEDSDTEISHIRGVACSSDVRSSLQTARKELGQLEHMQAVLQQSLDTMRGHEHRLEIYLLLMKLALLMAVCLLAALMVVRLWRWRNERKYITRHAANIVFQSSATMNSNGDH